uniref:WAP domain-containing protein n=1 Tax=Gouania willdenowi TaxID=441366 RepID=A0A8C5DBM3_GOUWI
VRIHPTSFALDKPGTCPRELLHIDFSHCHEWKKCDNDYDCPGKGKCCNTPCGQKCANLGTTSNYTSPPSLSPMKPTPHFQTVSDIKT